MDLVLKMVMSEEEWNTFKVYLNKAKYVELQEMFLLLRIKINKMEGELLGKASIDYRG